MRVNITIECDNDAFHPSQSNELARILQDAADRVLLEGTVGERPLLDLNGNTVGRLMVVQ